MRFRQRFLQLGVWAAAAAAVAQTPMPNTSATKLSFAPNEQKAEIDHLKFTLHRHTPEVIGAKVYLSATDLRTKIPNKQYLGEVYFGESSADAPKNEKSFTLPLTPLQQQALLRSSNAKVLVEPVTNTPPRSARSQLLEAREATAFHADNKAFQ